MGYSQLKAIRELSHIFDAETKIPNRDALLTPPDSIMNKITELPRVEDKTAPPPRVDPDKESKNREQKLPSPIQETPASEATRKKYTKKLKELVNQLRRGHYTGNKYDLLRATHRYNTRAQGTRVYPMAQHAAVLATNIQVHYQANFFIDPTTGASLEYRHLLKGPTKAIWGNSFANKIGRLAQGVLTSMPYGTNTIFFIPKDKVPAGRTVTYGRIAAEIRPQKAETHRTRLNVGGNLINFPGVVTTPTADLITAKLIFNSVLSTKNVKFMCADISNFYLNNPMNRYEYMKLTLDIIPEEIIQQYNLRNLVHKVQLTTS